MEPEPDMCAGTHEESWAAFLSAVRPRAHRPHELLRLIRSQQSGGAEKEAERPEEVLARLMESGLLREAELRPEVAEYKPLTRYITEGCTPIEIAATLRGAGYISHETALFLHGLSEGEPSSFYVNQEQSAKRPVESPLTQEGINRAFKVRQRQSRYVFQFEGVSYTLLSGKNTRRHGVEETKGPSGEMLWVAGLERTLVDIVVRPAYAGGVGNVAKAYRHARNQDVSVSRLVRTLRTMGHRYPYHQAVGFLMERAGFEPTGLKPLRKLGVAFDFYLDYGMKDPAFDDTWRIYYPQCL